MSSELLLQQDQPDFLRSPTFLQVVELTEKQLREQEFIDKLLSESPHESIEDVGAVVHETNRIPDSRILIIKDGKILRLDGVEVDRSIEKSSYLGKIEYQGFETIKPWANTETDGAEVWFSAPFPENIPPEKQIYPVSKVDIGEIRYSSDKTTKILLKKAILLDIDSETLLGIANKFADMLGYNRFRSTEELRSKPVFCTEPELEIFFGMMSEFTNQIAQVTSGEDLAIKLNTYDKLKAIQNETVISSLSFHGNIYNYLRQRANEEKMIGDKSESCPTAFKAYAGQSRTMTPEVNSGHCDICGTKLVCGHCKKCNRIVKKMS